MLATLTPLSKRTAVCEASALARAVWTMVFGAAKRCLTFEFSRGQRHGAWPARRMMYHSASRAKCHAGDRRLQRGVRRHSALAAKLSPMNARVDHLLEDALRLSAEECRLTNERDFPVPN
jgi:hypothetical protein